MYCMAKEICERFRSDIKGPFCDKLQDTNIKAYLEWKYDEKHSDSSCKSMPTCWPMSVPISASTST